MSIAWAIDEHAFLETTQSVAKERAFAGASEGVVVQAQAQSAGTGRHGRHWDSPKGNLYLSILLRPECSVSAAGQLSFVVSLALLDLIDSYVPGNVSKVLKWPNDVLLASKKCAGILLETDMAPDNTVNWVVVGLGLNVNHAPDIGSALGEHTVLPLDIDTIRDALLDKIDFYYAIWRADGFPRIRQLWLERSYDIGTTVSVNIADKLETGAFHGIDDVGNLMICDDDGQVKAISAGEVHFNVRT